MLMEFSHSRYLEPLGEQDTKSPQGGELELGCPQNPRPLKDEMLHEIVDCGGRGSKWGEGGTYSQRKTTV